MLENIYHTIRGRYKSPRTLESNSKDPISAAKPFWSYSVWKIEEVSYGMLVLSFQHVLSRFSGRVVALPCLLGKLRNLSLWKVSEEVIMPFCVAGVALPVLQNVSVKDRSVWQAQYIAILASFFRRWLSFFVIGAAVRTCPSSFHVAGAALIDVWCCVYFCESECQGCVEWRQRANQVAGVGHRARVSLHRRGSIWCRTIVFGISFCKGRHSIGTLHFTFHTIRFTLYTSHFTLATFHSTFYTLHFQLYTSHFKFTFRTPHPTLYTPHSTLYTPHSALYTLHFTLRTLHCRLCTPVCTLHFALHTWNFTLHTLHSSLHFTLYWVDVATSADDKVLCQIVVCLWGKAHMGSTYDFNLLTYFLIFFALRIGTRCLPVISLWVYALYSQRWKSWQLYTFPGFRLGDKF